MNNGNTKCQCSKAQMLKCKRAQFPQSINKCNAPIKPRAPCDEILHDENPLADHVCVLMGN